MDNQQQPTFTQRQATGQEHAVALAKERRGLTDLLQGPKFKAAVAATLPKHVTPDRFIRVVLTATMRTPDLLKCSQESLFKCCFDLSALGLEPDGRRAHLIPRKNRKMCMCGHWKDAHRGTQCSKCTCNNLQDLVECTLVVDYKGLVELVRRSGEVAYIHADVVYEKDHFDFMYGSGAILEHKPNLEDRGKNVVAIYSFVKLKDGTEDFIVLSRQDVERVREASPAKNDGPWVSFWDEMAKKTAFRRHSKWLPFSAEIRAEIEQDDSHNPIDPKAEGSVLDLSSFAPSLDEHRGHDDSMVAGSEAGDANAQQTHEQQEQGDQQKAVTASERSLQHNQETGKIAIRHYAKGEMPDAMDLRVGLQCYHDGGHFQVMPDGDFQKWTRIGDAPLPAAEEAKQTETAATNGAPQEEGNGKRARPVFGRKEK
jgi:recombination protein RecT